MTDYDIPDLPSDEDLGITPEDLEALESEEGGEQKPKAPPAKRRKGGGKPPKPPKPAPPQPAPQGGSRGLVTLVVLLLAAWLSSTGPAVPRPVPANAPDTAFSSARAMSELVEIARRPHPPGSPEHGRVLAYLVRRLGELGLQPRVDSVTSMRRSGTSVRAAAVHNVMARIPGTESSGAVLIVAHYDSRAGAVGAADDGAGVVAILEAVRAIRAGPHLKNDVIVLFTDAEEEGMLGARAFAARNPWMSDVRLVLNLEMRGAGGPVIMFQTGPDDGWVVHELAKGDPRPFANSVTRWVYGRMPNDTDFSVFLEHGKQGLNFAAIGHADVYHQHYDDPENLSEGTLQDMGLQALSMLRTFGGADLSRVSDPDIVYFRIPFVGLVTYPAAWNIPIGVLILLLFAGIAVLAHRKGLRWSGMVTGLGLAIVATAAAYGLGAFMFSWLERFHPEFGALAGSAFHREGWYVLALTAGSFFVLMTLLAIARLRFTTGELSVGAVTLPTAGAVALTFTLPSGAMNLQWPVLAALVATAVAIGYVSRGRAGRLGWILTILFALPVLAFLVPLVQLVWLAGSFRIAADLGVMITITLLLLMPVLGLLEEPNRWWPPLGGLAVGALCLGIGILLARPSATRPEPSTLLYALDHPSGDAIWATRPEAPRKDSTVDSARAWARERTGAKFISTRSLAPFFFQERTYAVAPARAVQAPGPAASVVADTIAAGQRLVRIAVRSNIGAERLLVRLPADSVASLRSVDGEAVPPAGGAPSPFEVPVLDYWGLGRDSLTLDFDMDSASAALDLVVVEQLLRPDELLGNDAFHRPPDLAPNLREDSDRALFRSVLRLGLGPGAVMVPTGGQAGAAESAGSVGAAGADSARARPDSTAARPDSVSARGDSGTASTDSATIRRDSAATDSAADTTGGGAR